MVTIFDEEEVYTVADASTNELNEFVESITMTQLELLTEFFNSIPALEIDVESNCNKCQRDITTKLRGLNSFF